jgi:hypothetical protein
MWRNRDLQSLAVEGFPPGYAVAIAVIDHDLLHFCMSSRYSGIRGRLVRTLIACKRASAKSPLVWFRVQAKPLIEGMPTEAFQTTSDLRTGRFDETQAAGLGSASCGSNVF